MSQGAPPGPTGAPFIGSLIPYLNDRLEFLESCAEYGDVVKRTVMGDEAYLLFHPDNVERVMVHDYGKFQTMGVIEDSCSDPGGPAITPQNNPWGEWVQALAPAFTRSVIDSYVDVMAETTADWVDSVEAGERVDVLSRFQDLVLEITMKTLFGERRVADERRISRAYNAVSGRTRRGRQIVPRWAPTPGNWRMKREAEFLYDLMEDLIAEARGADLPSDSLLGVLLAASEREDTPVPSENLPDILMTLVGAANETTALGLTFTWYHVAGHPHVQRRVREEADEVLGDDLATAAEVSDLEYAEKVIDESLRLYPPNFEATREAKEPVSFDGYTVPEGGRVLMPQWVVHRDERWFDDPEEFRPGRWTDELEAERPDFAFFPFSGGPKQCIGQTFATVEMKVVLATALQRLDVEMVSDEGLEVETALTLRPKHEVETALTPRAR